MKQTVISISIANIRNSQNTHMFKQLLSLPILIIDL